MRSQLFAQGYLEAEAADVFSLQNSKLLKVALDGEVLARQGSMVAYQGQVDFDYEGSGGVGRLLKKAFTGEGVPLMRCAGRGELFLADDAHEIHLLRLEDDWITVNGRNILAFEPSLQWDIRRVEGVGMLAGGLFNTVLNGTGWLAITAHGTPVVLQTDMPTFVDAQSAIAWSSNLQTSVHKSFKLKGLVGRGSGEAVQLAFAGQGFVIVQASEGPTVPPHSHAS
ncbi:MAG: AIM24 family protein [Actinomycetota bacterium]|nr:AIM24 family protein [Actinomycetota bacterium]